MESDPCESWETLNQLSREGIDEPQRVNPVVYHAGLTEADLYTEMERLEEEIIATPGYAVQKLRMAVDMAKRCDVADDVAWRLVASALNAISGRSS